MDEQQRIAVIGSPGSGKSTLARALADATGLPLVHLDRAYWRSGWVEPSKAEWQALYKGLIGRDRWIIDGNYGGSLPARLARVTLVVWLDLPTRVCLAGALQRKWRYRRRNRPDMAEGCPERFDAEYLKFLGYIITFRGRKRAGVVGALVAAAVPVVQLRSTSERTSFLAGLAEGGLPAVQGMARLASSRIDRP